MGIPLELFTTGKLTLNKYNKSYTSGAVQFQSFIPHNGLLDDAVVGGHWTLKPIALQ